MTCVKHPQQCMAAREGKEYTQLASRGYTWATCGAPVVLGLLLLMALFMMPVVTNENIAVQSHLENHSLSTTLLRGLQLKNREEELMKLAKQFDKNLTDAIRDQDASCHHIGRVAPEAEMSIEPEDVPGENREQFLGEHLQTSTAVPCGVVEEESSGRLGHSENRNREPVDLDAEVALNELFDGPTQACSDSLSQGLSEDSSNSSFLEKQSVMLQEERPSGDLTSAAGAGTRDPLRGQGSTAAPTAIPAEKAEASSEPSAPGVVSSKTELAASRKLEGIAADDFDDWGDDSFLMQITQNPELMGAPENAFPCASHDRAEIQGRIRDSEKLGTVGGGLLDPSENIPATHISQKQSTGTGKANGVPLEFKKSSISKPSPNKNSGCNPVLAQSKSKSIHQDFTRLKCPANGRSSDQRAVPTPLNPNPPKAQIGNYGSNKDNIYCQLSTSSAGTALPDLKSTPGPGSSGRLKPKEAPKKSVFLCDDWNKPKFSDEVLDFYCESDSLWDTNYDDDLLYQVCDAVEKKTLSQQATGKEEKPKWVAEPPSKLEAGPCPAASNPGPSDWPLPQKTRPGRKTFSLDAPATVASLLKNEHLSHPAVELPSKGESIGSVPGKWCRSHSVPEGDLSAGTGSPVLSNGHPNVNDSQWQNGLGKVSSAQSGGLANHTAAVKSSFLFRKTGRSQALALDHGKVSLGKLSGTHLGLAESKNASNVPLQTTVQANAKPPFKWHLSDSFAHPETGRFGSRSCGKSSGGLLFVCFEGWATFRSSLQSFGAQDTLLALIKDALEGHAMAIPGVAMHLQDPQASRFPDLPPNQH